MSARRRRAAVCLWAALSLMAAAPSPSAAAAGGASAAAQPRRWARLERMAMGTRVVLSALVHEPTFAFAAFEAALEEIHRLEVLMTSYRHPGWPASDLARLESAAGRPGWVTVAPETCAALELACALGHRSGGALDVTVAPLVALMPTDAVAPPPTRAPGGEAVAAARARLGQSEIELDCPGGRARLGRAGVALDLSAVAKGAIVDAAAALLRARGLADFVVEAGGDLVAAGRRGAAPWRVALPEAAAALADGDRPPHLEVRLVDQALATSGDQARGGGSGGQRLHHLIDPATGRSARGARTVSVVAPSAARADAWATALFVMPPAGEAWASEGFPLVTPLPATNR